MFFSSQTFDLSLLHSVTCGVETRKQGLTTWTGSRDWSHEREREGQELNNRMCSLNIKSETRSQNFVRRTRKIAWGRESSSDGVIRKVVTYSLPKNLWYISLPDIDEQTDIQTYMNLCPYTTHTVIWPDKTCFWTRRNVSEMEVFFVEEVVYYKVIKWDLNRRPVY